MQGTKDYLFHKVSTVHPLPDFRLLVGFKNGETKEYDVKQCFDRWPIFKTFQSQQNDFYKVGADPDGFGVIWNEDIDLGCNELYNNGTPSDLTFTNGEEQPSVE